MKKAIVIESEAMGSGSDELGRRLMGSFLRQLSAGPDKPDVLIFYNSGVNLLVEGSAALDGLKALDEQGIELIACGTCVSYYQIRDRLVVGRVSDMREIAAALMSAESVVTI